MLKGDRLAGRDNRLHHFPETFFVIAGPCVLEDDGLSLEIAHELAEWSKETAVPVIFKASFDKANRSSPNAPRGPGLVAGLKSLQMISERTGLPTLTDVHETRQVDLAAAVVDVLQIPAFLCRQTDLIRAAASTGRLVNIKKGQWMSPQEMRGPFAKAADLAHDVWSVAVTERGTIHGYGDLVVDFRSLRYLRELNGPVIFDATHSVQRPGRGPEGCSGGDRTMVPFLAQAAMAVGIDGLFLEVHPTPNTSPSDAASMLRLRDFRPLMRKILAIRAAVRAE